jgi:hypothetical protein
LYQPQPQPQCKKQYHCFAPKNAYATDTRNATRRASRSTAAITPTR